ncbi:MAG TPA: hypothetical protein EYP28_05640 [Methanophagales archaeon]|nr:hypothetical protein [Methanophagales archaeon]
MMCAHKSCGIAEKVWHLYEIAGVKNGVKRHSYCIRCGTIKRGCSSSDRPKSIGYYINALSEILKTPGEKKRITKVQIRLIVKELEGMADFCDMYWVTKSAQEGMFISVVQKYCKISEGFVKSFL